MRGVSYTENKNSFSYYVRQTIKSCSHTQQEKDKERGKTEATQQVANCIHIVCVVRGCCEWQKDTGNWRIERFTIRLKVVIR